MNKLLCPPRGLKSNSYSASVLAANHTINHKKKKFSLNRTAVAVFCAFISVLNSAYAEELTYVDGNHSSGKLSLDSGEYDQIFGQISDNGVLNDGQSTLSGEICVACGITNTDPISGSVIGAFGNAIIGNQVNAETSGGLLTVSSGQYFSNNTKITSLPDFIGLAGNIINAESGFASAINGVAKISGGSVNQVELSSTGWQASGVSGNYVRIDHGAGEAEYGQAEISGGTHTISFFGNQLYSPDDADLRASNGNVTVTNQATVGGIHGNYAYGQNGSVETSDGSVTVQNASVHGNVLGNFSFSWNNSATSTKGNIDLDDASIEYGNGAYGIIASAAQSQQGVAKTVGGSVVIKNTSVNGTLPSYLGITGAYANVIWGTAGSSTALTESGYIEIENSSIGFGENSESLYVVGSFAKINGGSGDVSATNGTAIMENSSLNGSLRGAIARTTNGTALASDNRAVMIGGEIINATVYGSYVYINNGTGEAQSLRNSVEIHNASVEGDSGSMIAGTYVKAENGKATASENTVVIESGSVNTGYIFGAYARSITEASAENNTVILDGTLSKTVVSSQIYGGYTQSTASDAVLSSRNNLVSISGYNLDITNSSLYGGNTAEVTGNVLNVSNFQGQAQAIGNFETLNFTTDLNDISWGQGRSYALLDLSEGLKNEDESLQSGVNLVVLNGDTLQSGQTYTVVSGNRAETLVGENLDIRTNGLVEINASWDNQTSNQFNIHIDSKKGSEDSGLIHTPDVAAAMMISEGSFLLDQLMPRRGLFAIAQASSSSTDLHADIDVDGFNLMTGVAGDFQGDNGLLRVAAFLEYGDGDYSGKRHTSDLDGDTYYYDAGIQGTFFYNNGLINELSFRFGVVHSDGSFVIDEGMPMKFDKESGFITAHAGLGWQTELADGLVFNPYARYHYLRINSDRDQIDGIDLKWDDYVVQRTMLGAKLESTDNERWNWQAGVAWEHVFDANASAKYGEVELDDWNMEGDAGVVHATVGYQFEKHPEWNLELTAKGKFGDYQGWAGKVTLWRLLD